MKQFPFFDLHQDLLMHIRHRETFGQHRQTDFEMIKFSGARLVVATAFPVPPEDDYFNPITNDLIETDFRYYKEYADAHADQWMLIKNLFDLKQLMQDSSKTGLMLHIEGLNVVSEADWPRLESWYDLGWRSLGMVWNLTNPLGGGTTDSTQGLTALGIRMIEWLQRKRMLVDFAHMNAPTFWDATKIVQGPIWISHGNAASCCQNPRNYTDEQLTCVAERGGVVGVFFAKTFVTGREKPGEIGDVIRHIDHLVKVMGIDHVALGTDFGGIITGSIEGLASLQELPALWRALEVHGYTDEMMEKIAWRNAHRVLQQLL